MAVTLTACDSTAPGTAVPACPSQRPRARGEGGGREAALEKARAIGWGARRVSVVGQEGRSRRRKEVRVFRAFALSGVMTSPLILVLKGRPSGSAKSKPAQLCLSYRTTYSSDVTVEVLATSCCPLSQQGYMHLASICCAKNNFLTSLVLDSPLSQKCFLLIKHGLDTFILYSEMFWYLQVCKERHQNTQPVFIPRASNTETFSRLSAFYTTAQGTL